MDITQRQTRGCGFLPRSPLANCGYEVPDVDFDPTVCPGYSTGLHEVAEVVHYRPSWSKGYLAQHLGESPTSQMLDGQNALEGSINAKQAADMKKRAEEAKRNG